MDKLARRRLAHTLYPSVLVALIVVALTPSIAHAGWLEDVQGLLENLNPLVGMVNFITQVLRDLVSYLFQLQSDFAKMLLEGTVYTDFTNLFGGSGQAVYNFAIQINNSLVRTVGYTILSIAMLIQIAKLGSRTSSADAMPMIRDIAMLMVWLVIVKFLIDNSAGICELLFTVSHYVMSVMQSVTQSQIAVGAFSVDPSIDSIPELLLLAMIALLGFIVVVAAWLLSYVIVWGRALQIYLFTAFSVIPISLMATDETRPYGLGFLKMFLAACLSLAIIMFLFMCFPLIHSIVASNDAYSTSIAGAGVATLTTILRTVAIWILLLYALVKSGSWAKDLLG